ncbi:hypothetical protein Rumeso_02867 [Rubellimicrobium mesophilum DSM 19309]|uniref:TadE-like domain-containing protein n=1 Tax=Rubellimicrobium mesophilum DSM 19309 TaxID=442562 RepID=A0A017HMF3_9RHOB|nr:TadE/TadG family type IV pilus assembly protein [Rubellimicrobium mesophilum]EYD75521.1 hypothetical protein Rumeso_02867 [Rubellimicrobium mesophilum DSM 19309]
MREPCVCLTRFARRFARDENGAVTVEAVIWIPFFFFILMLITDASLAFFSRAEAFRIVQNYNRAYSVGDLTKTGDVETRIEGAFTRSKNDDATTTVSADKTVVTTQLSYPIGDVMVFTTLGLPSTWRISVSSEHYVEWPNP